MGKDESLMMSNHVLKTDSHKVIIGVFTSKQFLLVHFDLDGYNVECKDVVVKIGDRLCNGCHLLFRVDSGRDEPVVERHFEFGFIRWVQVL